MPSQSGRNSETKRHRRSLIQTLDGYVFKRFLSIYLACVFSFTFLYVVIDLVNHFERFARQNEGGDLRSLAAACFGYYVSMVPVTFCQILGPVTAVASALFAVTTFQRANEVVPIQASGRSLQRTLMPIVLGSAAISLCTFALQELWIPRSVESIERALKSRSGRMTYENFNYPDRSHGNLISVRSFDRMTKECHGVLVLPVWQSAGARRLINAERAVWRDAGDGSPLFTLLDGRVQRYSEDRELIVPTAASEGEVPELSMAFDELPIETNLVPEFFELREEQSVYMSLADLRRRTRDAPDQSLWVVKYMGRFSTPAVSFILVFLGLPIVVRFGQRNVFVGAILSVLVAASYHLTHSMFQELGVSGHIPARVGSWLAPSVFIALGATFYRDMKS